MFCTKLALGIFGEDNACLVVAMQGTGPNRFCNPQFVKEMFDPYVFLYSMA